jgi:glycosyltransferase involved in cell wall biosynthesis
MGEPLRILHIVPALFGSGGVVGGAERYALELARHMADFRQTTLVSFGEENRSESLDNLNIRVLGGTCYVRGQRSNPVSAKLLKEVFKADVVHCHQQHVLSSSLAAALCRISGRRVFVSDLGGGGWDISAYISTDRWYHGHLHISEYSRRQAGHAGNSRAHVIMGGVDTEKFKPAATAGEVGPVVYVGRLMPHKGVDDLVEALPEGIRLELIGQPYHEEFVSDLRRLAAGKDVHFRHDCNDDAIVAAYRRALCVVLPSVYRNRYGGETRVPELLGQTLLEGMACGVPVICTDVASMPEVVEDGVTGFVVPPNDARALRQKLLWLRDNPSARRRMGEAARRSVLQNFTWPRVARSCLEIYSS